MSKLEIEAL